MACPDDKFGAGAISDAGNQYCVLSDCGGLLSLAAGQSGRETGTSEPRAES
jgi:hypothetical protein